MPLLPEFQAALQALLEATAAGAQHSLAWLGTPLQRQGERLHHAGGFVAEVHLDCTALWPAVVLVALLVLFGLLARVSLRRLASAAALGVGAVALVNQVRLVGTLWLAVHVPAAWPLAHEFVGPLLLVMAGAGVVVAMVKGLPRGWRMPASRRVAAAVVVGAATGAVLAGLVTPAAVSASPPSSPAGARPGSGAAAVGTPPVVSGAGAPAGAPMVSGDLIVKFRDASEPGAQLAAVLAGQRTVATMVPLATRLSAELGVPLALVQVTSGREALLALDREALGRALLARAGREAAVRRASVAPPPAPAGLPGSELVLRIEMHASTQAAARDALGTRLALGQLVRPRLALAEAAAGTVSLHYDIDALTLALITRLQQRADVEYAQANRLLRPAPGGGAASGAPR